MMTNQDEKHIEVSYCGDNSIFIEHGVTTLTNVSDDFIHGFNFVHALYDIDHQFSVKVINGGDIIDYMDILLQCITSDNKYDFWTNGKIKSYDAFSHLCDKYDITVYKRYAAIVSNKYCRLTVVQFDSLDFLNAVITYWMWNMANTHLIHGVIDVINRKSYQIHTENRICLINKRSTIKKILSDILISDIINMIWGYIMNICESECSGIVKCVNEIDITNEVVIDKGYRTSVYIDEFNTEETVSSSLKWVIRCPSCSFSNSNKPYLWKVKLV
jgi:hypothetical protein